MSGKACLLVALFLTASWIGALQPSELDSEEEGSIFVHSRAVTTWSGTVQLSSSYTVASGDELRVLSGTTIEMSLGARLYVDGRLSVLGTDVAPVLLTSGISTQSHEGLQFNTSSNGFGSVIRNLTIQNADYGATIYGSNPLLDNLTILDPDYVGVDLFNSATPTIVNLHIDEAGQDLHGFANTWRYGLGLSIGAGSAPVVTGLRVNDAITRGINVWGGSGGLIRDSHIHNVSLATQAISAGVWVEDSILLFQNLTVNRSDHGVYVRHITETGVTRPTFRDTTIENSMYVGVFIERYNHSLYANIPMNAQFEDLTVRGTGGPNAKAPGLCTAALNINTSGVYIENALIEDNDCIGFRGYMMGPSTTVRGLTVNGSGEVGASDPNLGSGIYLRSVNWAPTFDDISVSGAAANGIHLRKASLRGTNWSVDNSSSIGLYIRESHPEVDGIIVEDNGLNGVHIFDANNVLLENVVSARNGVSATGVADGVGYLYEESNTLTAETKDVTCRTCTSIDDAQGGIMLSSSIDVVLENQTIVTPTGIGPALRVDNSAITRTGVVTIRGMAIHQEEASTHAVSIGSSDARINGLNLQGNHSGMFWTGSGASGLPSSLASSTLTGPNCLSLTAHSELSVDSSDLSTCTGSITVQSSSISFDGMPDSSHLALNQPGASAINHVKWISSGAPPSLNLGGTAQFDQMWRIHTWAVNQNGFGLPHAEVNLSFDHTESAITETMPYAGNKVLGPFVGMRTDAFGSTSVNEVWTGCLYASVRNDTGPTLLDADRNVICELLLPDQAPLIIWSTPVDEQVFPSGGEVVFNATESWDLESQAMTFSWTSNIDGDLHLACAAMNGDNGSNLTVNNQTPVCFSDGTHDVTLEVCDTSLNCANETRRIELTNLPPSISLTLDPPADATNRILLARTEVLHLNASASTDPEGMPFTTSLDVSFSPWADDPGECNPPTCPLEYNISFEDASSDIFDLVFVIGDGLNPATTYSWTVEIYNELPHPDLLISRDSDISSSLVTLDARGTNDPEGDSIVYRFHSSIDGDLLTSRSAHLLTGEPAPPEGVWVGHLSPGAHTITLGVGDSYVGHIGQENLLNILLIVNNTPSIAVIDSPSSGMTTDSAELIRFNGSGSGDWDLTCPEQSLATLVCNEYESSDGDLVSVLWTSNLLSEPLGSDWVVDVRLPAGIHDVTLSIDDGSGSPATAMVRVEVSASAPILILDSPVPGISVSSDGPVLFDFRNSFDPDGDMFTVSITSDLHTEPLLENGTIDYWYNDYLLSGAHTLTFTLEDETGAVRIYQQTLQVDPSAPVAVIGNITEGTYAPPGASLEFIGAESYDYDDDIIRYEWRIDAPMGTVVSTQPNLTYQPSPGIHLIHLTVIDSLGSISIDMVNITAGSSSPMLSSLSHNPKIIRADEATDVIITVVLDDPDRTTGQVQARVAKDGIGSTIQLNDNGSGVDEVADDGIWSGSVLWTPNGGGYARLEAWATDGDTVSPTIAVTINVEGAVDSGGLLEELRGDITTVIGGVIIVVILLGGLIMFNRRRSLARDLELIESWGGAPSGAKAGWDATTEVSAADAAMSSMNMEAVGNTPIEDDDGKIRGGDLDWDNV